MNDHAFDAFARRASAAASRRSLAALGGAGVAAALAAPLAGDAKPSGAKKAKKKAQKKCKRQGGQCTAFFDELCDQNDCSAEDREAALDCCARLRSCNANAFLECLFELL